MVPRKTFLDAQHNLGNASEQLGFVLRRHCNLFTKGLQLLICSFLDGIYRIADHQAIQNINNLFMVEAAKLLHGLKTRSPIGGASGSLLQFLIILRQPVVQFFIIQTLQSPSWLNLLVV
ncbi:hypothetical protein D3C87_1572340 [compost metagenome]